MASYRTSIKSILKEKSSTDGAKETIPRTVTYSFRDYRSQGQTIYYVLVDAR